MIILTDRIVYEEHTAFFCAEMRSENAVHMLWWTTVDRVPRSSLISANDIQEAIEIAYRDRDLYLDEAMDLLIEADIPKALEKPTFARLRKAIGVARGTQLDELAAVLLAAALVNRLAPFSLSVLRRRSNEDDMAFRLRIEQNMINLHPL